MIAQAYPPPQTSARSPSAQLAELLSLGLVTPEFVELLDQLRELFGRRDSDSVAVRYEIGRKALAARRNENRRYGREALQTLAAFLQRSERTLCEYSRIAEQWSRAEIDDLMARRDAAGKALVWSHFRTLDRDGLSAEDRRLWIETALREGLGHRQLSEQVAIALGASKELRDFDRAIGRQREVSIEFSGHNKLLAGHRPAMPKLDLARLVTARDGIAVARRLRAACDERIALLEKLVKESMSEI